MWSLVLGALLSVAVGHPVTPDSTPDHSLVYSGKISTISVVSAPAPAPIPPNIPSPQHTTSHLDGSLSPSGYTHDVELARRQFHKAFSEAAALVADAPGNVNFHKVPETTDLAVPIIEDKPYGLKLVSDYTAEGDHTENQFHNASTDTSSYNLPSPEVQVHSHTLNHAQVPVIVLVGKPTQKPNDIYTPRIIDTSNFTQELEAARKELLASYEEVASRVPEPQQTLKQDSDSQVSEPAPVTPLGHQYTVILTSKTIAPSDFAVPDNKHSIETASPFVKSSAPATKYAEDEGSTVNQKSSHTSEAGPGRINFHKASEDTSIHKPTSPEVQVHTVSITRSQVPVVAPPTQPTHISSNAYTPGGVTAEFTQEVETPRKEFLISYDNAASGVPESQQVINPYSDSYDIESVPAVPTVPAGHQQTVTLTSESDVSLDFTPEVEQARKEFMRVNDAAVAIAAKTPDYSAVTHITKAQAPEQGFGAESTPEMAKATAEFMAAWNAAAARVATIEAKLVKSSTSAQATITIPEQAQTVQEIERAVEEFVAAWNAAVQRTPTIQQAVSSGASKPEKSTEEIQTTTAEFMAAWQAAARRASNIEQAMVKATSLPIGVPQHVEAMAEAQKATAEFMAAWNAAAARVPKIETAMYSVAQPAAVGGTREFLNLFKLAEDKAVLPSGSVDPVPVGIDAGFADSVGTAIAYAGTTASFPETVSTLKSFPLSHRLFAPVQGLPVYYDCKCE